MSGATNEPLSGAYRVVWRWHFYAGLLVLPFLMMLALTGGLYLFASEIDDLAARPLNVVTPGPERVSADRWVAAARVAADGQPVAVRVPDRPDRAVQVVVQPEDGARRAVFVNPYDGQVSGVAVAPPGPRARAAVLGIVLPLAILYPLTGLSLLAAVAVDRLWRLVRRPAAA